MQSMDKFTVERNNCRRRLIMLVKKHPILWNKKQEDYKRNRPLKMQIWQAIADEMGSTSIKIRRTWENLRDQYRRDLKRELKYGFTSKWRFFWDMDFIRDMVTCKRAQPDLTDSDSEIEFSDVHLPGGSSDANNHPNNTEYVEHSIVEPPPTNQATISPKTTEFQPIILSRQWQNQSDNGSGTSKQATNSQEFNTQLNTRTNTAIYLQPYNIFGDIATNVQQPTAAQTCTSSVAKNRQQQQQQQQHSAAIDIIDLEKVAKIEPEFIKLEPNEISASADTQSIISTVRKANELCHFQESHVSTSNPKHTVDLTEDRSVDFKERNHTPRKKKKTSNTDLDTKDEDYYFVMSLLPSLRLIPRNKKFALRISLMNLVLKELEDVCK